MLKLVASIFEIFAALPSNVPYNYFNNRIKLFSDLTKFLDTSVKLFFLCI